MIIPSLHRYAATANEIVQFPREIGAVLVQRRVAAEDSAQREVGFAVDAEPDLARLDVRIEQIEDHVGLQNAVATIRFEMLSDLEQINQTNLSFNTL